MKTRYLISCFNTSQPNTAHLLSGCVFHLFFPSLKPLLASCNMSSSCSCVYANPSFSSVSSENRALNLLTKHPEVKSWTLISNIHSQRVSNLRRQTLKQLQNKPHLAAETSLHVDTETPEVQPACCFLHQSSQQTALPLWIPRKHKTMCELPKKIEGTDHPRIKNTYFSSGLQRYLSI